MIGETVSHYNIVDRIGSGGMGIVYKAQDTKLGRLVALKFLSQDALREPQALERFRREARTASALNHPNICVIYDIDEHQGQVFLAMELLEGQTLRELLHAKRPDVEQVLDLAIQIADALEAAHRRGIVHRDVKPANMFVTRQGQVKVLDFGLAKLAFEKAGPAESATPEQPTASERAYDHLTSPGLALGTVAYMSPEQARGEELDARTDIFSLGATLYEMLTGRQAFTGTTSAVVFEAILNRTPTLPRQVNGQLPPKIEEIVLKALEKDRELRYQTAGDLRADLRRLKRELESSRSALAMATAVAPRELVWWRRTAALGILVLLIGFFSFGLGYWSGGRSGPGLGLDGKLRQLTFNVVEDPLYSAAISPDGRHLAHATFDGVFLRLLETGEDHRLTLPEGFCFG